jgi:hypothetical protein
LVPTLLSRKSKLKDPISLGGSGAEVIASISGKEDASSNTGRVHERFLREEVII